MGCSSSLVESQRSIAVLGGVARNLPGSSWWEFEAQICHRNVCLAVRGGRSRSLARMREWNSWRPTSVCVVLSWLSSDLRSWSCSNASVWRWLFDDSDLLYFCLENYSQLPKIELRIVKDRLATKVAFLDSLLRYWSDWGWTNLPSRLHHTSS